MANIVYQAEDIARYFSHNRIRWDQFYESERKVIGSLSPDPVSCVLDIGCGCGGLGLALLEKFGVTNYTGVEINASAAKAALSLNPKAIIHQGDILELREGVLAQHQFDMVFSLSCVDWNVEFSAMLGTAWQLVAPGGSLVATFRLSDQPGCRDMAQSYQHINYEGRKEGELAAYVVLNAGELMVQLGAFDPAQINLYGYWGPPSATAVTPYDRLCFVACTLRKRRSGESSPLELSLELPDEVRQQILSQMTVSGALG